MIENCVICNCSVDEYDNYLKTAYPTDRGYNEVYLCEDCTNNIVARSTGMDDPLGLLLDISERLTNITAQIDSDLNP